MDGKYKYGERIKCAVLQDCAAGKRRKRMIIQPLLNRGGVSEDAKTHLGTPPRWRLLATSEANRVTVVKRN
jgi:hypothetical protein